MRGRNTRTDNPPRVSFYFILKSDIEIFVWSVVKVRISISSVGATTGRPRSLRSQNAHPSVIFPDRRGRRPRRPEKDKDKSQDFDRKSFLNCRDRRPRLSNVVLITNCISVCYQNKDNGQKKYIDLLF